MRSYNKKTDSQWYSSLQYNRFKCDVNQAVTCSDYCLNVCKTRDICLQAYGVGKKKDVWVEKKEKEMEGLI